MTELVVDWCSYEAAKYAVMHWHYSEQMPKSKLVRLGVWEDNQFIGAAIFGASANNSLGRPYGLEQTEVCELVRIALKEHQVPVTQIVSVAIGKLRESQSGLRLIVSFADPAQDHLGTIYQAGNWVYAGTTSRSDEYIVNGKQWHGRALRNTKPANMTTTEYALALDDNARVVKGTAKHRYLYPLDRTMRRQILPLAKPYPKAETSGPSVQGDTSSDQEEEPGSSPGVRSYSNIGLS